MRKSESGCVSASAVKERKDEKEGERERKRGRREMRVHIKLRYNYSPLLKSLERPRPPFLRRLLRTLLFLPRLFTTDGLAITVVSHQSHLSLLPLFIQFFFFSSLLLDLPHARMFAFSRAELFASWHIFFLRSCHNVHVYRPACQQNESS